MRKSMAYLSSLDLGGGRLPLRGYIACRSAGWQTVQAQYAATPSSLDSVMTSCTHKYIYHCVYIGEKL